MNQMQPTTSSRGEKWKVAAVLVVVAAGSVPAGRAFVRERKAAIARMCDDIFVAVSGELAAEITPEKQAWIATCRECFARGVPDPTSP